MWRKLPQRSRGCQRERTTPTSASYDGVDPRKTPVTRREGSTPAATCRGDRVGGDGSAAAGRRSCAVPRAPRSNRDDWPGGAATSSAADGGRPPSSPPTVLSDRSLRPFSPTVLSRPFSPDRSLPTVLSDRSLPTVLSRPFSPRLDSDRASRRDRSPPRGQSSARLHHGSRIPDRRRRVSPLSPRPLFAPRRALAIVLTLPRATPGTSARSGGPTRSVWKRARGERSLRR